jgi:hypothetical protein
LSGKTHLQAPVPIFGVHLLELGSRAGDPGIVDEHVETAERHRGCIEQVRNGTAISHVAM